MLSVVILYVQQFCTCRHTNFTLLIARHGSSWCFALVSAPPLSNPSYAPAMDLKKGQKQSRHERTQLDYHIDLLGFFLLSSLPCFCPFSDSSLTEMKFLRNFFLSIPVYIVNERQRYKYYFRHITHFVSPVALKRWIKKAFPYNYKGWDGKESA